MQKMVEINYLNKFLETVLTLRNRAPSMVPVAPKLQQEPHTAWSFTGVTAPKNINGTKFTRTVMYNYMSPFHQC